MTIKCPHCAWEYHHQFRGVLYARLDDHIKTKHPEKRDQ